MTFSRITPARLGWIVERMGIRDLEIVETLLRVRVASAKQFERLHFYGGTPLSNARASQLVLKRLTSWHVLNQLDRRIGGVRAGSAGYVYALGIAGQRLTNGGPAGGHRHERPWTPSHVFMDHTLAVTELYVRLRVAARAGVMELDTFETEPGCWRRFSGPAGEVVTLKPDALVRLTTRDFTEHAFIEVDLGTESRTAIRVKLDRYRAYWASGQEQRFHAVFPRVLWLVPSPARYKLIVDMASRQPAEAWQLFKVAEFDNAIEALVGDRDD